MPITPKLEHEIQFLSELDATQFSVSREDDALSQVNKRSTLRNFFSWVIYLITFTMVPRNRELDEITREILKDFENAIQNVTEQEKALAEKAIQNLQMVIANNGGSEGIALEELLETIAKIQALPAVQQLSPKNSPKKQHETVLEQETSEKEQASEQQIAPNEDPARPLDTLPEAKEDPTQLQRLLQDLLQRKALKLEIREAVERLLPEISITGPLSVKEWRCLANALAGIEATALQKMLSPTLVTSLVSNNLLGGNLWCTYAILLRMDKAEFDQEQIRAFVRGVEIALANPSLVQTDMDRESLSHFVDTLRWPFLEPTLFSNSLKTHLTDDELISFFKHIAELVANQLTDDSEEKTSLLICALILAAAIELDCTRILLEVLPTDSNIDRCVAIVTYAGEKEIAIEWVLTHNPPKTGDPQDTFFKQLIDQLNASDCSKIAEYVLTHESQQRKQILAAKLSPSGITQHMEHIPSDILENLDDQTFVDVAVELQSKYKADNGKLKAFAAALTKGKLDLFVGWRLQDLVPSLLPLCAHATQVEFVSKVLDDDSFVDHECLKKATLQPAVWEEASRTNPSRTFDSGYERHYPTDVVAQIVNGQIGNPEFLRKFFMLLFVYPLKQDDATLKKQKEYLTHLKPAVFEYYNDPEDIGVRTWYRFFRVLREMPDKNLAKQHLIAATTNLFNAPSFRSAHRERLYTLKNEQLALLPIDQFKKPHIRLLLACLTGRLDDSRIDDANSLFGAAEKEFMHFFEPGHTFDGPETSVQREERDHFAFRIDRPYFKDFLLWILDRQDVIALLPTWTWLTKLYEIDMIKDDPEIQGHIKRLGLFS